MTAKDYTKFSKYSDEEVVEQSTFGTVVNCERLNIRAEPNLDAEIICVINASSEVVINNEESTNKYYKVYTVSGIEGFCMKDYIEIVNKGE